MSIFKPCSYTLATHIDKFLVALSSLVCHAGQMGIPLLTILANHFAVVMLILPENINRKDFCELLRVSKTPPAVFTEYHKDIILYTKLQNKSCFIELSYHLRITNAVWTIKLKHYSVSELRPTRN